MSTSVSAGPPGERAAIPGRDLTLLLLLLAGIDVSGLLHVYSLSSLYGEELFLGLGALVTLLALALLALPAGLPQRDTLRPQPRWLLGLAAALPALALAAFGVQQLFLALPAARWQPGDPPLPMPAEIQDALLTFALGALSLLAIGIGYGRSEQVRRIWLTLLAAGWFAYAVGNLLFHLTGGPAGPVWAARLAGPGAWALGALGLLAVLGAVWPASPPVFLLVTVGVGLGLRVLAFSQIPVNMDLGDMLPLITLSTGRLLGGASPYHLYQVPYDLALTYWPLNVLPFVPFQALHLDLRGANLLLGLGVAGALLLLRRGRRTPGWACYAFGVLYLTPTMFQWDLVTAAPPFWLWLSLLCAVIAGAGGWGLGVGEFWILDFRFWIIRLNPKSKIQNPKSKIPWPGLALGAACAAGPLALPFAAIIGVWWLRRGWRYAAWQVGAAVAVGAVAVLPFVLWDGPAFRLGAIDWFNNLDILPRAKWVQDKSWLYEIGFAGQIWKAGLDAWFKPLQIALLGVLAVASWWGARTPAAVLRWGSAAYLLFMVVNPVIWPYLFTPALLGLVFSLAAREQDDGRWTMDDRP